jgi:hypothetical protein
MIGVPAANVKLLPTKRIFAAGAPGAGLAAHTVPGLIVDALVSSGFRRK